VKRGGPIARKTPLRKRNNARRSRLHREQYGEDYGEWIREQECAAAGEVNLFDWPGKTDRGSCCYGPIEAHHVRTRGAGGKAERNLVPLCLLHHADLHRHGRATFEKLTGTHLKALAARLWSEYHGGEW